MTKPTKRRTHSEADGNGKPEAAAHDNGNAAVANGVDLTPWIKASEAMFNGMMTLGQEMGEFATARLRENMEFTSTVMRCGDPQEAVRLEMDYARHATQQYLDEWVYGVGDRAEYWQKLGQEKHQQLKITSRPSVPVDYGNY